MSKWKITYGPAVFVGTWDEVKEAIKEHFTDEIELPLTLHLEKLDEEN